MAKGLCEVVGLPLAGVSRLEVLAEAADLREGFAVLDAGRGSLYVREQRRTEPAHEYLVSTDEFERTAAGAPIIVAEKRLAELLDRVAPLLRELRPIDLLKTVQRCLADGGSNVALADANYVLPESQIYARPHHTLTRDMSSR
jgi:tRNA A37 threonylcarbamoyladenosine modification protein TsaB